jgi:predicted phage-related endonuclease
MLSPAQIKARKGLLTSTRMKCLMEGDAPAILQLYYEMTDDPAFEPVDLSDVWPVRLGEATEALNLEWYERKNNCTLTRQGEVVVHPHYDWAAATLDGWDAGLHCPVEAKCVGGREPLELVIDRYQPQCQWLQEVTGAKQCALSIIVGANPPVVEFIDRDAEYAAEMIVRGRQFIDCVTARRPPVALPAVPPPIDVSKYYDMTGRNEWAASAATWLATKATARDCVEAEKYLKSIVPPDAKKCTGYGVVITRDRAGRLSLREIQ